MEDLLREASEAVKKAFEAQGLETKPLVLVTPEEDSEGECPTSVFFLSDESVWVLRLQPNPSIDLVTAQIAYRLHLPKEDFDAAELERTLAAVDRESLAKMWTARSPTETAHVVEISFLLHAGSPAGLVAHLEATVPGITHLIRFACWGLLRQLGVVARQNE